ncbi:MAG: hypothetical protein AVDCRST_MAG87-3494, partial [uncultured Thermomicrobiales bacterium]
GHDRRAFATSITGRAHIDHHDRRLPDRGRADHRIPWWPDRRVDPRRIGLHGRPGPSRSPSPVVDANHLRCRSACAGDLPHGVDLL